jgi:beta-lactam-binding protein with PASTA domain
VRSRTRLLWRVGRWACAVFVFGTLTGCGAHTAQLRVPAVVGLREGAAVKRIHDAGFTALVVRRASKGARDVVVAQSPSAGATATRGARVKLVVRIGT